MLLLFQVTACGPTSVGNAGRTRLGSGSAQPPAHAPLALGTSPGTQAFTMPSLLRLLFST